VDRDENRHTFLKLAMLNAIDLASKSIIDSGYSPHQGTLRTSLSWRFLFITSFLINILTGVNDTRFNKITKFSNGKERATIFAKKTRRSDEATMNVLANNLSTISLCMCASIYILRRRLP